jgi:hypothetical protein
MIFGRIFSGLYRGQVMEVEKNKNLQGSIDSIQFQRRTFISRI